MVHVVTPVVESTKNVSINGEWPRMPQTILRPHDSRRRDLFQKFSVTEKGKSCDVRHDSNLNLNSTVEIRNANSDAGPSGTKQAVLGFNSSMESQSDNSMSLVVIESEHSEDSDLNKDISNLNSHKKTATAISPIFENEEAVDEYLQAGVSIPYLQMVDSMGNIHKNGDKEIIQQDMIINFDFFWKTNEKWSTLKHKVNPSLRKDFENFMIQMISVCPKLGIHFQGSQNEIGDAMVDGFKSHLLNFDLERNKFS